MRWQQQAAAYNPRNGVCAVHPMIVFGVHQPEFTNK
jgi:hypothetical protein